MKHRLWVPCQRSKQLWHDYSKAQHDMMHNGTHSDRQGPVRDFSIPTLECLECDTHSGDVRFPRLGDFGDPVKGGELEKDSTAPA